MTQLTSLQLPRPSPHSPHNWAAMFPSTPITNPTNTTTLPLTYLQVASDLTDGLLSALLTHTPGLKTLSVLGVAVQSGEFRDRVWGVEKVDVSRTLTLMGLRQAVTALPRPREGQTQVCEGGVRVFNITDAQVRRVGTACLVYRNTSLANCDLVHLSHRQYHVSCGSCAF